MKRALSTVLLDTQVGFPNDRNTMPMSTLIASDEWRFEAEWDGSRIGDVQMFRNANLRDKDLLPEWQWYGAVPCVRIRGYRWVDGEPEAKPRQTAKGAAASGSVGG